MGRRSYIGFSPSPLLILAGILVTLAIFRSNSDSLFATTSPSYTWNTQDLDATKNGNTALAIYLLDDKGGNTKPVDAVASNILAAPSNYFGKYLQLSGTVESVQAYPSQSNLLSSIVGNVSECVMMANDGATVIDCLLVNAGTLGAGSNITIDGSKSLSPEMTPSDGGF